MVEQIAGARFNVRITHGIDGYDRSFRRIDTCCRFFAVGGKGEHGIHGKKLFLLLCCVTASRQGKRQCKTQQNTENFIIKMFFHGFLPVRAGRMLHPYRPAHDTASKTLFYLMMRRLARKK